MEKQLLPSGIACKVKFSVTAEVAANAKEIAVLGDFNNWSTDKKYTLKKNKDGNFNLEVELPIGKDYQFRYLIDGQRWENAHNADAYVASPYMVENSLVSLSTIEAPVATKTIEAVAVAETKAVTTEPKSKTVTTKTAAKKTTKKS